MTLHRHAKSIPLGPTDNSCSSRIRGFPALRIPMMKFISLRVRNAIVMHGYTDDNKEIVEEFNDEPFMDKLIAIDRIQSVSGKYVLVTSSHGRVMYWEYEGEMSAIQQRLAAAGLVVA
jgi:hypothetical protein